MQQQGLIALAGMYGRQCGSYLCAKHIAAQWRNHVCQKWFVQHFDQQGPSDQQWNAINLIVSSRRAPGDVCKSGCRPTRRTLNPTDV
jgi:hypothetical protein